MKKVLFISLFLMACNSAFAQNYCTAIENGIMFNSARIEIMMNKIVLLEKQVKELETKVNNPKLKLN